MDLAGADHAFFAGINDFYRPPGLFGQHGGNEIKGKNVGTPSQGAADVGPAHHDLVERQLQQVGQRLGLGVGRSGRHPDFQAAAAGLVIGNDGVGFEHAIGFADGGEAVFADVVGLSKALFNVADVNIDMDVDVVGMVVVNEGGAVGHGFDGVENRRQGFILHVDQLQGLQSNGFVIGGHRRHLLADVTDLVDGNQLVVAGIAEHSPLDVKGIVAGRHRPNPRQHGRPGDIDAFDQGVGMKAVQNLADQHVGQFDVGGKKRLAGRFRRRVNPGNSLAQNFVFSHSGLNGI